MRELNRDNVDAIQSACNPVAVANQLAEWIKQEYERTSSMDAVRDSELICGVIGKLCDLFRIEHDGAFAYRYMQTLTTVGDEK